MIKIRKLIFNQYLITLAIIILIDISDEIKILTDHLTLNSIYFAFLRNPLATFMIFSFPFLHKNLTK